MDDRTPDDGPRTSPPDVPEPPGRAGRDPDEGPAVGGGSSLESDDEAADEEVGGGD